MQIAMGFPDWLRFRTASPMTPAGGRHPVGSRALQSVELALNTARFGVLLVTASRAWERSQRALVHAAVTLAATGRWESGPRAALTVVRASRVAGCLAVAVSQALALDLGPQLNSTATAAPAASGVREPGVPAAAAAGAALACVRSSVWAGTRTGAPKRIRLMLRNATAWQDASGILVLGHLATKAARPRRGA
mmetsp:Transcript_70044/g.121671  ORF Transcript_70044/g.121671 Transcript_70044/m.121671 type:complete len:193 (-) Transcript_70044:318-896(-)